MSDNQSQRNNGSISLLSRFVQILQRVHQLRQPNGPDPVVNGGVSDALQRPATAAPNLFGGARTKVNGCHRALDMIPFASFPPFLFVPFLSLPSTNVTSSTSLIEMARARV